MAGAVVATATTTVVIAAARTGVAAVAIVAVVVAVVVVDVVVLVAQLVVILEGVDRAAQILLDSGTVGGVAWVEGDAVLHEPGGGVDVEGDVGRFVGHHEA